MKNISEIDDTLHDAFICHKYVVVKNSSLLRNVRMAPPCNRWHVVGRIKVSVRVTRECVNGGNKYSVLFDGLGSFFCRSHVPSEAQGTNSGFSAALFIYSRLLVHF